MKIGIVCAGYNCEENVREVLQPWLNVKDKGLNITIACSYSKFKHFQETKKDNSLTILKEYHKENKIDYLYHAKEELTEQESRNQALYFLLEKNVDLIWLVDLQDEFYTEEEIFKIVQAIKEDTQFVWYKINFKNYFETHKYTVCSFPRIWKNNYTHKILKFVYDNEIVYEPDLDHRKLPHTVIPREIAFVKHLSWVGSEERIKNKIDYQTTRYGKDDCMFLYSETEKKAVFNEKYFEKFKEKVEVLEDYVPSTLQSVHLILRTCSFSNVHNIKRSIEPRDKLTLMSCKSLAKSIKNYQGPVKIKLTIVDDHSTNKDKIKKCFSGIDYDFVDLLDTGNPASLQRAFSIGYSSESDVLYFLEDDYLHQENMIQETLSSYSKIKEDLKLNFLAMHPFDDPDRYKQLYPSYIVKGISLHWRTVFHTTCTFLITKRIFIDCYQTFSVLSHVGEKINGVLITEDNTCNQLWMSKINCFSPLPSLSIHSV